MATPAEGLTPMPAGAAAPVEAGGEAMSLPALELPPALRPFAWAGYLLGIPSPYRLATLSGDHRRGRFSLSDDQRVRLEVTWATPRRRRVEPAAAADRHLRRFIRRFRLENASLQAVPSEHFPALRLLSQERQRLERAAAYHPLTRRIVECVYYRGTVREDLQFRRDILPSLRDQPGDRPVRWAFFDHSFLAPPGFTLGAAGLNLGDMRVRLHAGAGQFAGAVIVVRLIYPGSLALSRQSLETWVAHWAGEFAASYRARGAGFWGRGKPQSGAAPTSRGPGVHLSLRLRLRRRLLSWRAPRQAGLWMIHDQDADRLLALCIAEDPDRQEELLRQVLAGLHWNRPDR